MLTTLTVLFAAIVVLGLVVYLAAVTWALLKARASVTRIADALESVGTQTAPLQDKLATINGALTTLSGGLATADRHLGRAARVFRL